MTVKTFGVGCGAVVVCFLGLVVYRFAAPWHTYRFGVYEVRRNLLNERAQVLVNGTWRTSLNNDPTAANVPERELSRIKLSNLAFGERGYFCGQVRLSGTEPIRGRLAFNITVTDAASGKRRMIESERSLRVNVSLRPGAPQTFLIQTDMTPPSATEKFAVVLVPIRAE